MDLHFGMNDKDTRKLTEDYESHLTKAIDTGKITTDDLLECIIAGEQYHLKNVLSKAIKLASTRESNILFKNPRFNISCDTRVKILGEMVIHLEGRLRLSIPCKF